MSSKSNSDAPLTATARSLYISAQNNKLSWGNWAPLPSSRQDVPGPLLLLPKERFFFNLIRLHSLHLAVCRAYLRDRGGAIKIHTAPFLPPSCLLTVDEAKFYLNAYGNKSEALLSTCVHLGGTLRATYETSLRNEGKRNIDVLHNGPVWGFSHVAVKLGPL